MPAEAPRLDLDGAPRWKRAASFSLVVLALGVTAPGFDNRFVQDDLPLILRNETVHSLSRPAKFFTTPYWHDPFPPAHYRPLATAALALQWKAGDGAPTVFRWVSAGLLAAAAIALLELAALFLPLAAAAAAAGLFVVHPVHVEATALGVNQGELAVAILLCLATAGYLRARRRGDLSPGSAAVVILLFVAAGLFKENGLVLPGLLLAGEWLLVRDPRPLREKILRLRPFYLLLALAGLLILAVRQAVLGGKLAGTFTADALAGADPLGRAGTMLGVVPEWARLLLWPAHLQADYGPDEIAPAAGFGPWQWAGGALLLVWLVLLLASRRRLPAFAFGLCWIAVAILPVSNVLIPTGIVLAERTLFLASAGVTIAAGALLSLVWRPRARPGVLGWNAAALVGLLIGLGIARSRSRDRVWFDQETLLRQTVVDAPRSYAAHLALTRFHEDSGGTGDAAREYRKAVEIRPSLVGQDRALADEYRRAGFCRPAVRLYRRALTVLPGDSALLASLRACGDSVSLSPTP